MGNVTQQGTEALAVVTGTICVQPNVGGGGSTPVCQTNNDRNIALDRGQTFAQAYARATQAGATGQSFVLALVQSGGQWYVATA